MKEETDQQWPSPTGRADGRDEKIRDSNIVSGSLLKRGALPYYPKYG